jgi:cobalt-zinc-cadmium efflux system protein
MNSHHHPIDPKSGDSRVIWAIVVNLALTLVQIVGGIVSGSLALIADAIHNLSDALSLVIAFGARKIARFPADEQMTYGYGRAEIIAALINYTTLILVGLYLCYEGVVRLFHPTGVDGWLVVIVAAFALIVDLATALLTYSLSKESINIRAAFLHNLTDALGSIAVIVAGTTILLYDWRMVDPLVTLMIACYILRQSISEIGGVIRILMLGSPPELKFGDVLDKIRGIEGVVQVHHVHLWQMQEHESALNAHIVIDNGRWSNADGIKEVIKLKLHEEYGIEHTTLELECATHACVEPKTIGH